MMTAHELLALWSDDPRYGAVLHELHPCRGTALALGESADDALVCMAAAAAIASARELLVAGHDFHAERIRAVAEACGAVATPYHVEFAAGSVTWWRFTREQVSL